MVPIRGKRYDSKKYNFVIATVALAVVINQALMVMAFYIPYGRYGSPIRRQDSGEEDELDQTASAPYQQGDNGRGSDGYEENEPDGPYGETPREEEGQADMEKFFDDHLGASERDGMDKENLPTNLDPTVFTADVTPVMVGPKGLIRSLSGQPMDDYSAQSSIHDSITSDLRENSPDRRADPNEPDDEDDNKDERESSSKQHSGRIPQTSGSRDTNGSEVVAVEDEDADKIYITNMTNQPFRIDALGGYDPEEDFQAASRDIEEAGKMPSSARGRRRTEEREPRVGDITFSDPEADTLFNDASETDEVTFAYDDPYQTDLEAEIQGHAARKAAKRHRESLDDLDYDGPSSQARRSSDDDSDSSWVNDGVDDMEIPSQAYQDSVLDKAAKQQALDERNAAADNGSPQQDANPDEIENQRMPNADYMKEDMKDVDDKAR